MTHDDSPADHLAEAEPTGWDELLAEFDDEPDVEPEPPAPISAEEAAVLWAELALPDAPAEAHRRIAATFGSGSIDAEAQYQQGYVILADAFQQVTDARNRVFNPRYVAIYMDAVGQLDEQRRTLEGYQAEHERRHREFRTLMADAIPQMEEDNRTAAKQRLAKTQEADDHVLKVHRDVMKGRNKLTKKMYDEALKYIRD